LKLFVLVPDDTCKEFVPDPLNALPDLNARVVVLAVAALSLWLNQVEPQARRYNKRFVFTATLALGICTFTPL
jgi:hypothetical protein